jgi:hypothetical protein
MAAGCRALEEEEPGAAVRARIPVVVVGSAPDASLARAGAEASLRARLRDELSRREGRSARARRPAERVHDWTASERALERLAPALLEADSSGLPSARGAVYTGRVSTSAFEAAVEEARVAGVVAPVRVACVPLALPEDAPPDAVRLRELYGAALRAALDAAGVVALPLGATYGALDEVAARADRPLGADDAAGACRVLGADALVHGRVSVGPGAAIGIEVELRDALDGRVLGRLDGQATEATVASLARRHALSLKVGLGVERVP